MDRFYEDPNSLFVTAYDAFYAGEPPQIAGDVAFYEYLARETGGPMLELGCVVLGGSRGAGRERIRYHWHRCL